MTTRRSPMKRLATASAVLASTGLVAASVATTQANAQGLPYWHVTTSAAPTDLPPGGEGNIVITVANLGDGVAEAASVPVTISDKLPAGLTATSVSTRTVSRQGINQMSCSLSPWPRCDLAEPLAPYSVMQLTIAVKVEEPAGTELSLPNEVLVEGGEAPPTVSREPLTVKAAAVPFGIQRLEVTPEAEGGSLDTQAGSHPFQLTTALALNTTLEARPGAASVPRPAALPKDLHVNLPPGLIGNPSSVPQCTMEDFITIINFYDRCSAETAVGVALVTLSGVDNRFRGGKPFTELEPLFNLAPAHGEPARLGFLASYIPIVLDTAVRTGHDYGVTVSSDNILETGGLISSLVTVWGAPGDARHDASRGWACLDPLLTGGSGACVPGGQSRPVPFLTMPTACDGPFETSAEAGSWPAPDRPSETAAPLSSTLHDGSGRPLAVEGCDRLPFNPTMNVQPEGHAASTPTGLNVDLRLPQESTLAATGLGEADVKDTTVALPEGLQVSPSSANGLEACSEAQIGFSAVDPSGTSLFSSTLPEPFCPDASKVGVVHIKTPLLPHELEGGVYLAAQTANPFGSLLALYIVAQEPVSGVLVKLAGQVHLDARTGQAVSTFKNTPQLPFEELKLEFFGGARGPLSTPPLCGAYETSASLTPWSGGTPSRSASSFAITSGPSGSPCADPLPFSPSLTAGSMNLQAGAFTSFTTTMSREDGNQNLAGLTLHMPPGLLGKLSSVTPCPEPQASEGTCGPQSLIGHTHVLVGLGATPYAAPEGRVFITQSYRGAPYGLAIAQPAKAGPFDLGSGACDCVLVRAKIEVDPHTSALTVVSDPLPTILQGIPLQIKRVDVAVDRPGFTFNPTRCSKLAITAALSGEAGASATAAVPFQLANCATLPFKPRFTVLTQARTSKANGASLHVKVTSGPGQANIGKVKVDLPKQLPSRLTTLQKACPDRTFNANPASCPAGSVVGSATAVTPVLGSALTGPAYLVSHAAASFPDLVIVLQGEGITLDLVGNTDIRRQITISTFDSVPDAPISTFDLVLPEGPHSVLGANLTARAKGSLCGQTLLMPTTITGQNGAVVKQRTRIAVSGCPKHRARRARLTKRATSRAANPRRRR
jgi:hypothetical protein